jgi:hypothetical protein
VPRASRKKHPRSVARPAPRPPAEPAADLARRVIAWSNATRPTSLRHDAADAILIGLWSVLELGWLETLPDELRR